MDISTRIRSLTEVKNYEEEEYILVSTERETHRLKGFPGTIGMEGRF